MDFVIVGGGRRPDPERLRTACAGARTVLAADSGANWLRDLALVPDVLIGDFDSIAPGVLSSLKDNGRTRWVRHRVDKDQTDMELCVEEALRLIAAVKGVDDSPAGCDATQRSTADPAAGLNARVRIFGGIGSRMDHSLANLLLLHPFLQAGVEAWIEDGNNRITMLGCMGTEKSGPFRIRIPRETGFKLSLVALSPVVREVVTLGLQYDMRGRDLCFGSTLAVSNEFGPGDAEVTFREGLLLLLLSRDAADGG